MKSLEMEQEPSFEVPSAPSFPSFYVCDEQMPEIATWEPEVEYTLTVKVRVVNKNQNSTVDGVDTNSRLEILAYEVS